MRYALVLADKPEWTYWIDRTLRRVVCRIRTDEILRLITPMKVKITKDL